MDNFHEVFLIILSLFANLKQFKTFLVYKLKTFKNCKEVKHVMIMFIATIYIFLSNGIFDQQLKITFRKSSTPPEKIHSSLFTHLPPKNSKSKFQIPFLSTLKIFPTAERGGGRERTLACM